MHDHEIGMSQNKSLTQDRMYQQAAQFISGESNQALGMSQKQPPVIDAMDKLDQVVERAMSEISELAARLSPVLRNNAVSAAGGNDKAVPLTSCLLDSRLTDTYGRTQELVDRLRTLRDALCI